jgi:hypothetical protein
MLIKLPLGLGSTLIIPIIKFVTSAFVSQRIFMGFKYKKIAKRESNIIHSAIRHGAKQAIIVIDNLTGNPTYGELISTLVLSRYFIAHKIHVSLYIIDHEYRYDWGALSESEIKEFVSEQIRISKTLLDPNFSNVQKLNWNDFEENILRVPLNSIFPYAERVRNRLQFYDYNMNLINNLLSDVNESQINKILFSFNELALKAPIFPVKEPYISWVCRYSEKWAPERNLKQDEFIKIYAYLRKYFPNHAIMVISDIIGCAHYSKIAESYSLNCIFSKQYSQTFLGDSALILNSDFLFQVRGGGIGIMGIYSRIPYVLICPMMNLARWSRRKKFSWQTGKQFFIDDIFFVAKAIKRQMNCATK